MNFQLLLKNYFERMIRQIGSHRRTFTDRSIYSLHTFSLLFSIGMFYPLIPSGIEGTAKEIENSADIQIDPPLNFHCKIWAENKKRNYWLLEISVLLSVWRGRCVKSFANDEWNTFLGDIIQNTGDKKWMKQEKRKRNQNSSNNFQRKKNISNNFFSNYFSFFIIYFSFYIYQNKKLKMKISVFL